MIKTFTLDDEEYKKICEWAVDHGCTITNHGAIGGAISICFGLTGIGVAVTGKCACGSEINATNYDNW